MDHLASPEQIGRVAAIWRYPVKSMRGEPLTDAAFDRRGLVGDRRIAFASTAAPRGKPLLSSRERAAVLNYAARLEPMPVVVTPSGCNLPLPSPELLQELQSRIAEPRATLSLQAAPERPYTDVRPVSLISRGTLGAVCETLGRAVDPQRFRSNLIVTLEDSSPFAEDALTGSFIRFGSQDGQDGAVLQVRERIPRCRIVSLDPETSIADPELLRELARHRDGLVGVYATVVRPGRVRCGDALWRLRAFA